MKLFLFSFFYFVFSSSLYAKSCELSIEDNDTHIPKHIALDLKYKITPDYHPTEFVCTVSYAPVATPSIYKNPIRIFLGCEIYDTNIKVMTSKIFGDGIGDKIDITVYDRKGKSAYYLLICS